MRCRNCGAPPTRSGPCEYCGAFLGPPPLAPVRFEITCTDPDEMAEMLDRVKYSAHHIVKYSPPATPRPAPPDQVNS